MPDARGKKANKGDSHYVLADSAGNVRSLSCLVYRLTGWHLPALRHGRAARLRFARHTQGLSSSFTRAGLAKKNVSMMDGRRSTFRCVRGTRTGLSPGHNEAYMAGRTELHVTLSCGVRFREFSQLLFNAAYLSHPLTVRGLL